MLKRILSLVLSTILFFIAVSIPVTANNMAEDIAVTEQSGLLSALGIIDAERVDNATKVTRGQFAEYLWICLKPVPVDKKEALFTDVPADSHITELATYGYFVGHGGTFEPNREMTIDEAYIVATRVTGYDVLANVKGGTTFAYSQVASRVGLTDSVSTSEGLSVKNAVAILYNILTVPVYDIKSVSDRGIRYDEGGENLLEIIYDIKMTEGIVTANNYTSIYENISKTYENSICIGRDIYECHLHRADKLLGRNVVAYYKYETGKKEIVFVYTDDNEDELLEIEAEDFINYSENSISFYKNERERSISLEKDAVFIHNGVNMNLSTNEEKLEALKMNYGNIRMLKSGKSSYYTVIITEYKTAIIKAIDGKNEIIYLENVDGTAAIIEKDKTDFFHIYNSTGNIELEFSSIGQGDLVTYALDADGNYAEIYVCANMVTGTVSTISDSQGEKILTINGEQYAVNRDFVNSADLKLGITTTYMLDLFGNIAYEDATKRAGRGIIAYFYAAGKKDKAFESDVKIKVYDTDRKHKVLSIADKCKLNGVGGKTKAEVLTALTDASGTAIRQIIMYTLNSEGFVNSIDTPTVDKESRENEQTLWLMAPLASRTVSKLVQSQSYKFLSTSTDESSLGYPMDDNTIVFYVPSKSREITSKNADFFSIGTPRYMSTGSFPVEIYKFNEGSPFADIVVMETSNGPGVGLDDTAWLVNDIVNKLSANKDGSVVAMNVMADDGLGGKVNEVLFSGDVHIELSTTQRIEIDGENISQYISPGDIIQIGTRATNENGDSICRAIRLMYDYSEDRSYWSTDEDPYKYEDQTYDMLRKNHKPRFTFGYVDYLYINHDNFDNNSAWTVLAVSDREHNVKDLYTVQTNWGRFTIFDDSRRGWEKAYHGIPGDIVDYQTGKNDASKVFVRWNGYDPAGFIFYK